jgi:regulator of sigma E protease
MTSMLFGALALLLMIGILGAVAFGGHHLAARLLQLRGGLLGVKADEAYRASSAGRRVLVHLAGPFASYLVLAALFTISFKLGGEAVPTTTVEVMDGPARAAGIADGDRIVQIDDWPITEWDEIRPLVMQGPGQAMKIVVERNGAPLTFSVTPDDRGRIMVRPVVERRPYGLGTALAKGFVQPALVVKSTIAGLLESVVGSETVAMGPVAVVREVGNARQRSFADGLFMLGLFGAYLWPALLLVESILAFSAWSALSARSRSRPRG